MAFISIILLDIDNQKTLNQKMDGLKKQTYQDYEVLLIGKDVCYSGVKVYAMDEFSLHLLDSEYVYFMHAEDEFWHYEALEQFAVFAQCCKNDVVCAGFEMDGRTYFVDNYLMNPDFKFYGFFIEKSMAYQSAKLYRTDFLIQNHIDFMYNFSMNLACYDVHASYGYIDQVFCRTQEKLVDPDKMIDVAYVRYFNCLDALLDCKKIYKFLKGQNTDIFKLLIKDKEIKNWRMRLLMHCFSFFMYHKLFLVMTIVIRIYQFIIWR